MFERLLGLARVLYRKMSQDTTQYASMLMHTCTYVQSHTTTYTRESTVIVWLGSWLPAGEREREREREREGERGEAGDRWIHR